MIENRSLWFSRIDQFDDQLEGRKPESAPNSPGEQRFFDEHGVVGWGEQYPGASDEQRTCKFGICWHMNVRENPRMWVEYTPDCSDSVAIVGSVKSIGRGLRDAGRPLRFSPVKYLRPDEPHPQMDYDSIFFYKNRDRYNFEKEYRILTSLITSELGALIDTDDSKRRLVPFNTNVGITRIVFHPDASNSFKETVRRRSRCVFGRVRRIENSIL